MLEQWYTGYGNATGKSTGFPLRLPYPSPTRLTASMYACSTRCPRRCDSATILVRGSNRAVSLQAPWSPELHALPRRSLLPRDRMALDKNDLPMELRYLVIVESALNPGHLTCWCRWPLAARPFPTGKIYGLTVNSLVDERMDPVKSTEAACRFLKDLYRIYGSWWLVLAAYNCGPGNVNRALRRVNTDRPNFGTSTATCRTRRAAISSSSGLTSRCTTTASTASILVNWVAHWLRTITRRIIALPSIASRAHGGIDISTFNLFPPVASSREQYALSRTSPPLRAILKLDSAGRNGHPSCV